ncbi:MAG: right-handed parallel beta-helix repeat-containing protein [Myxococcota bacterium]
MKKQILIALAAANLAACSEEIGTNPDGTEPKFSLNGKFDGLTDEVRFTEDLGKFADVRGQFVDGVRYRAFTLQADDGDVLSATLAARDEDDERIDAQLLVYGPVADPNALFDEVAHHSAMELEAGLEFEAKAGHYLVVAAREETAQVAKFDFGMECINCQKPAEPTRDCRPGRLFVEGSFMDTQEWDRCDVILLEATTLPEDETLVIGPDVRVLVNFFQDGASGEIGLHDNELTIDGTLEMETRAGHPVRFESLLPNLRWQGLLVNSRADLHDIEVFDALHGIELTAEGATLTRAKVSDSMHGVRVTGDDITLTDVELFDLEGHGIQVVARKGLGIERALIHDTAVAIERRQSSRAESRGLFLIDSEFHNNELVFDSSCFSTSNCNSLPESFIAGNKFAQNASVGEIFTARVTISSTWSAPDPEAVSLIADNVFVANTEGLVVNGSAALDGNRFEGNENSPLVLSRGHMRMRNNILVDNTPHCKDVDWGVFRPAATTTNSSFSREIRNAEMLTAIQGCATVRLDRMTGSVRNNLVRGNWGHGMVTAAGREITVQQNLFEKNGAAGLLFTDTGNSRFDVFFNEFADNEKHFGFLPRCFEMFQNNVFQRTRCSIRSNVAIEQNNVVGGHNMFRIELLSDRPMDEMNGAVLEVGSNFFDGQTDEDVMQPVLDAHPALEEPPIVVTGSTEDRNPLAGLLVPLE